MKEHVLTVRRCINELLYADVINNTFRVMCDLRTSLTALEGCLQYSDGDKATLTEWLLKLSTESIREALHKHELTITNSVIQAKNNILTKLKIKIPEDHRVVDIGKYAGYHW